MMIFFRHKDVGNSCKLVKHSVNLGQILSPFFHQNTAKRLARLKRQEDNREASLSLNVTSVKHIFFAFITSLASGRSFECAISQRKDENGRKKHDTPFITV